MVNIVASLQVIPSIFLIIRRPSQPTTQSNFLSLVLTLLSVLSILFAQFIIESQSLTHEFIILFSCRSCGTGSVRVMINCFISGFIFVSRFIHEDIRNFALD